MDYKEKKSIYIKKVLYIYIKINSSPDNLGWQMFVREKGVSNYDFLQDGKRDQMKLTFTTKTGRATAGPWTFLFSDLFYDAFLT